MRIAVTCMLLVACAKAGEKVEVTDAPGGADGGPVATACPAGQFATDVAPNGLVSCSAIDMSIATALDDHCSTYLGWRDDCDGCTTPPAKFGSSGKECANGAGANNTCTIQTLGDSQVSLFGLNFDGDVDGNDKLYGSLHCTTSEPAAGLAPCAAGQVIVGMLGSSWSCSSLADVVVDYVRGSCSLYLGWQDNCDGCTTAPVKWGHAGDGGCQNGAGGDNTCITATLGTESVNLFGLNPDGDVDGNDKLHIGLDCVAPSAASTTSTTTCPAGQFVTATETDGGFRCESIAPLVAEYFTANCSLAFAWQDNCSGCLTPPAKFGNVGVGACTLGAGGDNTCSTFSLGERSLNLFGLNTDGDVDGNDALYVGFRCL